MLSTYTDHARARMQQRGIRAAAVEALLDFGSARHLHTKGREMVFFDKAARERLFRDNPAAVQEADRLCRTYVVVGRDGAVVTVGHRYRRVPRG